MRPGGLIHVDVGQRGELRLAQLDVERANVLADVVHGQCAGDRQRYSALACSSQASAICDRVAS